MEMTEALKEAISRLTGEINEKLAERASATDERIGAIDERLKGLEEQKEAISALVTRAERMCLPGVTLADSADQKGAFSYGRTAKLVTWPSRFEKNPEYGYEVEVFRNMAERFDDLDEVTKTAINAQTGTGGAFIIPMEIQEGIIPELEAMSIAAALGVTRLDGLTGNVAWTKDEGGITAAYIDTEAEASGSQSVTTFSSIELRPHVLGAFVPLTWAMLNQPAMALESWVRQRIASKIALREDLSIFSGDSSNGEPKGVTNTTGISTMNWSTNPGQPVFSGASTAAQNISRGLRLMIKDLMDNDAFETAGRLGWALSPSALYAIGTTRDSTGRDIFLPDDQSVAMPQNLLGFPARSSSQLEQSGNTAEFLLFGDWSKIINAHWGTMAFASSSETETNFRKLRTTLRAIIAHDVGVLQPKAFSNASNFNITNALA